MSPTVREAIKELKKRKNRRTKKEDLTLEGKEAAQERKGRGGKKPRTETCKASVNLRTTRKRDKENGRKEKGWGKGELAVPGGPMSPQFRGGAGRTAERDGPRRSVGEIGVENGKKQKRGS